MRKSVFIGLLLLLSSCGYLRQKEADAVGITALSTIPYAKYPAQNRAVYDSIARMLSANCDTIVKFNLNVNSKYTHVFTRPKGDRITAVILLYDSLKNEISNARMPEPINAKILAWCKKLDRRYLQWMQVDNDGSVFMFLGETSYKGYFASQVIIKSKNYKFTPRANLYEKDTLITPDLRYQISLYKFPEGKKPVNKTR